MTTRTNTAKWTGTRWRIDVQKDGTRKSFYSSTPGRTGQREANAKADKWLQTGVTDTTMRVRQAYGLWYAAQQETTSEGNCRNIATRWRCWIEPNIGNKKLSALTEQDLQNIVNKAYAAGLSKKTLSCLCSDLRALCKFCRAAKLTTFNPEGLRVPAGARLKGKKVLQPADLLTLFNVDTTLYKDQTVTDDYINAYRFQVLTGLRPGELMGLNWEDVSGDTITVHRAVNDLYSVTDGKNFNAHRTLKLISYAQEELKAQKAMLKKDGMLSPWVFPSPSGAPMPQDHFRRQWYLYCEEVGIGRRGETNDGNPRYITP